MNLASIILIALVLLLFIITGSRLFREEKKEDCDSNCGSCKGCDLGKHVSKRK